MNWNARFHNATRAGLAPVALMLLTGGFSHFAAAQDTPSITQGRSQEARLFALPGPEVSQPRLLGRCPRPHRLLLRLGNVWGND